MPVTVRKIIERKRVAANQTEQYLASGVKMIIDKFTVTNTTTAAVTFSCNLPNSGDEVSDDNLVVDTVNVPAHESYLCPELVGQSLEVGDSISTIADTASALTISASGREII